MTARKGGLGRHPGRNRSNKQKKISVTSTTRKKLVNLQKEAAIQQESYEKTVASSRNISNVVESLFESKKYTYTRE